MRTRSLGWLLVLPALGVVELGAHLHFAGVAPRPEQWTAAGEAVAKLRREGDLVVIAPRWEQPVARTAFESNLMPLDALARPDESAYERALEVSAFGLRAPELEPWREVDRREVGSLVVRVLENPRPEPVVFDFVSELDARRVEVSEGTDGDWSSCSWTERGIARTGGLHGRPAFPTRRFRCASHELVFVGVTVIDDEKYRPRRCIWAHPPMEGSLRIVYRRVPLGLKILGYSGLSWFLMREGMGPPIELEVLVDGRPVGATEHLDAQGWKRFEFHLGGGHRSADVEFRVTSDTFADRDFCFYASVR